MLLESTKQRWPEQPDDLRNATPRLGRAMFRRAVQHAITHSNTRLRFATSLRPVSFRNIARCFALPRNATFTLSSRRYILWRDAARYFAPYREATHCTATQRLDGSMTKPIFEVSPDTRKLMELLESRDRVSYGEMNQRIGRFVNGRDRYVLSSALRLLQRDQGIVFVTERGVGVVRATNGQVASLGTDHVVTKTKRVVRRGKKLHPLVNIQNLPSDEREAFWIGRGIVQALDIAVGRRQRSRIAAEIQKEGEPLDVSDVITLFTRPRRKK